MEKQKIGLRIRLYQTETKEEKKMKNTLAFMREASGNNTDL
jgi:hypothetical protein